MNRTILSLVGLGFLAVTAAQAAPTAQKPSEATPERPIAEKDRTGTERDYQAARDRDEARQRLWDRKMKALTGSICTGC